MTPLTVLLLSALGGLFIVVLGWLVALVYALRREMADLRRDTQANTAELRQETAALRQETAALRLHRLRIRRPAR